VTRLGIENKPCQIFVTKLAGLEKTKSRQKVSDLKCKPTYHSNGRLMNIKKQKHWTSRTTMRNESVPEPFKEQISYSQTPRTHTATHQEQQHNMLYAEEISQK
jgi:hypothetical protein